MGPSTLRLLVGHDRERAQYLVDKWFWRSWLFFAIVTGFAMDYLTPLEHRTGSFREFVEEWILGQFERSLADMGLAKPWYWATFLQSLGTYHHQVYASAYTYRATTWFDFALPGPPERLWLAEKYPTTWPLYAPVWDRITARWQEAGPEVEWYTHGVTPIALCNLCQLVLCGGTPVENTAETLVHGTHKYVFCSAPCRWIFERESARYAGHQGVVDRILSGDAPGNLIRLVRETMGLNAETWGRDVERGRYPWMSST
jgi:toluene monooxygenase system protein A